MRILFFIIVSLIIVSCSSNKQVYWCGDHQCVNSNEKEKYFEENMIVEVKIIEKRSKEDLSSIDKILQQGDLNNKKLKKDISKQKNIVVKEVTREEKRLAKKAHKEEKRLAKKALKEEKRLAKKALKEEKRLAKVSRKKETGKNVVISKKNTDKIINFSGDFNEQVSKILAKNKSKAYPDLNDIQR